MKILPIWLICNTIRENAMLELSDLLYKLFELSC